MVSQHTLVPLALLHNQRERQWQAVVEPEAPGGDEAVVTVSADDLAWLAHLEQVTQARLGSFALSADDLADALSLSRRTFYRLIKRLTGLTPAQYLSEARFQRARRLLENRQVSSVKQVACPVGLRKVSHFAQLYRQRFGKGPADYQ